MPAAEQVDSEPFSEEDVQMVMQQTGVTHSRASECLRDSGGDLMDAIMAAGLDSID